jgi:hypothetical protein
MAFPTTISVRDLISELAQVEDAVRRVPTVAASGPGEPAPLHPELRALLARERDIIRELRRRRTQWRATCAPGHSLESPTP